MAGFHEPVSPWRVLVLLFSLLVSHFTFTTAQPATLQYSDCFSSDNTTQKVDVSIVYAQFFPDSANGPYINFTVIGTTPQPIVAASGGEHPVATTLFTTTELLTFQQPNNNSNSFFCATLRPASPLGTPDDQNGYCPLSAGPFAFSSSVLLSDSYELATFDTRLRALDPDQHELLCLDVNTTMLKPGPVDSVYGHAHIIFWCTVGLAIGYWAIVGIARLVAAWGRGSSRGGSGILARIESAGFILASALSGERFASSPALMRFCTPSLRDIIFHTQWCAALSMVAVQWPMFTYPLLSQTAWATLSYNISITQGKNAEQYHWNPLTVEPYDPPSNFADQLSNSSSPIFIDSTAPNFIFQLPANATTGISAFAWSVGVRPQDLFGICLSLFLAIIGATIVLSILVWVLDFFLSLISGATGGAQSGLGGTRSPRYSSASKDMLDGIGASTTADENRSLNGHAFFSRSMSRFPVTRSWWRWRSNFVSFHGSVLQGNLIRILILFHLPITIFSCYQMSLGKGQVSTTSIILAALSFAFFSVLIPAFLVLRLTLTRTSKLYDETWTLLSLGPLYNHYRHGSQLFACTLFAINIAFGVTIGFGQKSGTAQAIVILVVEVAAALGTSIWLPWGQGASMGLISFLFCVGRIVIAVLLVILTPVVSIGAGAAQWVAYAILFILGMIYLAFLLMFIVKVLEAILRIVGGVGFSRSRHVVDSGLLGTLGLMGCCGPRHPSSKRGYRPTERQPSTLALSRPSPPYKTTSAPSSGPPSVLRPEHAMQPYKEDSDDETGFIMGAWQPFPGPGYNAVEEQPAAEVPKSGFARVAGGRAHYDSPYAIASGSTHTFPSVDRERNIGPSSLARSAPSVMDDSPPPTPSISSAARGLPPGAMPPAHVRTKSQTAIIENAPVVPFVSQVAGAAAAEQQARIEYLNEESSAAAQPKKKHWYNRRKNRRMSESDAALSPPPEQDSGRSFVVMRKPRPGLQSASQGASSSTQPGEGVDEQGRRSFTVLRGTTNSSDPQAPSS